MSRATLVKVSQSLLSIAFVCLLSFNVLSGSSALAFGLVAPVPVHVPRAHVVIRSQRKPPGPTWRSGSRAARNRVHSRVARHGVQHKSKKHRMRVAKGPPPHPPQDLIGKLAVRTLAPGVVYKSYHGGLNINLIDVNMVEAAVQVRPVLAGQTFHNLTDVKCRASKGQALAAVNANYFKRDGTPLGTLIIDKEWVAGPLYDRVSLGINRFGFVRIDRVNLYGTLSTSNPAAPQIWVNNINSPRRTGTRLILYTRRWGNYVRLTYAGCLIAVNSRGEVVDKTTTLMTIPYGGFVLSDKKNSQISRLRRGDLVKLGWHPRPGEWEDVEQAVSGGPMLIKNGELHVDLKAEHFRKAWTGRQIQARTAAGITAYNHLLLVTIEGSHTLWDFAKFLRKLGAVDAMNLDGGGSTTMVVNGTTVTRNGNSYQRRVASSLNVVDARTGSFQTRSFAGNYVPSCDLTDFSLPQQFQAFEENLTSLDMSAVAAGRPVSPDPSSDNLVSRVEAPSNVP